MTDLTPEEVDRLLHWLGPTAWAQPASVIFLSEADSWQKQVEWRDDRIAVLEAENDRLRAQSEPISMVTVQRLLDRYFPTPEDD